MKFVPAVFLCMMMYGCGGGESAESGRAVFAVVWPERTRLIPAAANSIKVEISRGGTVAASQVIPRPAGGGTASIAFENLPVGEMLVSAAAYPGGDGGGVAQAKGSGPLTILAGQTAQFTVTLESTITSLQIATPAGPIRPGDVVQLDLMPRDAAGNLVLVSSATLEWTSGNPAVAAVNGSGVVTAGTNGTALITVTEWESQRGAMLNLVVEGGRLIAHEAFNYPSGAALAGQNGGTGFAGPWGESGTGPASAIDAGLFFLPLQARYLSARTSSTTPTAHPRDLAETLGAPGTTRYFSILLRPLDAMNAGTPATYFGFGFGLTHIGKGGGSPNYAIEYGGSGGAAVSGVAAVSNATVFLVARVAFAAGNDRIELWVNPAPGLPLPPNPSVVRQDVDVGLFSQIRLSASIRCHFDELRIGETYGDVSPIFQLF